MNNKLLSKVTTGRQNLGIKAGLSCYDMFIHRLLVVLQSIQKLEPLNSLGKFSV